MENTLTFKNSTNPYSKAAEYFFKEIKKIHKTQNTIYCALAGGTSVGEMFKELINKSNYLDSSLWNSIIWCVADERVVDKDSPELNYNTIYNDFFYPLIEKKIITENSTNSFDFSNEKYLQEYNSRIPRIDVAILSSGEDGHIGSLYPDHKSIMNEFFGYIDVYDSPKLPPHRVSASKKMLEKSKVSFTIFKGEGKKQAYLMFQDKSINLIQCPVKLVQSCNTYYIIADVEK